tara:strand:+ start:114389 stop:114544 length:156 start_codon:yes stop_codon:yes gene_type:complete
MDDKRHPKRWAKQLAGIPLWARKVKKRLPVITITSTPKPHLRNLFDAFIAY